MIFTILKNLFCISLSKQIEYSRTRTWIAELLYIEYASMDFLIKFLLNTNDWLSACVDIERPVNVIQVTNFNKAKSKQMAK